MTIYAIDKTHARNVMLRLCREGYTPSYLKRDAGELEEAGLIRFDLAFGAGWRMTDKGRDFLQETDR